MKQVGKKSRAQAACRAPVSTERGEVKGREEQSEDKQLRKTTMN